MLLFFIRDPFENVKIDLLRGRWLLGANDRGGNCAGKKEDQALSPNGAGPRRQNLHVYSTQIE